MKPQPEPSTQEVLAGLIERVTYHNAENGFCVLRAKVRGHRDVVTVVGHAATIAAGEWITASGEWINDRTHGQQFKARFLRTSPPTSADGIEKYLSSGMIRGVGPVYAKKLVRAFGEKVFDIIEATPDRLREVDGISGQYPEQRSVWARIPRLQAGSGSLNFPSHTTNCCTGWTLSHRELGSSRSWRRRNGPDLPRPLPNPLELRLRLVE
jgi:ATP-dependent exoDNAse (exonuclease V) alpha subunit